MTILILGNRETKQFSPEQDKTNKMIREHGEDADQPGHPPSLTRVFAMHSMGSHGSKVSSCGH